MILEWLQYLTTPAPRHIRSLGLVHEAIAIEARYKRCHKAWVSHLQNSRNQILATASELKTRNQVIVLGSGGLHDVPLEALSETFRSVVLWDVVHTRRVRGIAAGFPNVSCKTIDVTGLCEEFDGWLRGHRDMLPKPSVPSGLPTGSPDLVISLNLLSQLPLQMVARANAKGRGNELGDFADTVIRSHVEWLKALPCPVLLLTDLERHYTKGGVIEVEEALPDLDLGLAPGLALADWFWEVAPPGESPDYDTIHHKVGAFLLNG